MKKQPPIKEYIEDPCARLRKENAALRQRLTSDVAGLSPEYGEEMSRLRRERDALREKLEGATELGKVILCVVAGRAQRVFDTALQTQTGSEAQYWRGVAAEANGTINNIASEYRAAYHEELPEDYGIASQPLSSNALSYIGYLRERETGSE
jgi:hypothetical protein